MSEPHYIVARDLGLNTIRVPGYSHINLDLASNQAHALCAENKSGKLELLLTLAGRMLPTEGSLAIDGLDGTKLKSLSKIRRMSGLAFFDNVNEVEHALSVRTITSAELGLAGKRSNRKMTEQYLEEWGLMGVSEELVDDLDRYTYDLLGIALGMAGDPKILAVQEIERDLTKHESSKLVNLLRRIACDRHVTVVCGVVDYGLATHFDTVQCISVGAEEQRAGLLSHARAKEVA